MREPKFRAWDIDEKKMYVVGAIEWLGETIENILRDRGIGWSASSINNYILMQFTGLRDKNGREIYEGDVVQFRMSYKTETWIGEVKYEECVAAFMISAMNGEPWCSREFGIGTIEPKIIGNIHENPELLK